jgi:hypothetical protein
MVPQVQEQPRTTMDTIHEAVLRGVPMDTVRELMAMHKEREDRQARRAFESAMAEAKKELPIIAKNKHVGFPSRDASKPRTDYDHEDLAAVVSVVAPILGRQGLSHRFRVEQGTSIKVVCIISHKDGYFEESELSAGPDTTGNKNSIQAVGSTITYLQRYSLKAALGLAAGKDDDGNGAGGQAEPEKITEAQLDELIALADSVGADKAKFCRYYKIEGMAEILQSQFEAAKKALNSKKKVTEQ